jgi:hypothetical protein
LIQEQLRRDAIEQERLDQRERKRKEAEARIEAEGVQWLQNILTEASRMNKSSRATLEVLLRCGLSYERLCQLGLWELADLRAEVGSRFFRDPEGFYIPKR